MRNPRHRFCCHFLATITLLSIAAMLSGCYFKWPSIVRTAPPPCVLDTGMTDREILQYVNGKVTQILSWQSNDVKIRTHGPGSVPIQLSANIAVEAPRRFRLVAKSIMGYEADLGSNNERFWFWMRRSDPPYVFTVRHDQMKTVQSRMPIPLKPDWIMQALGVIPIEDSKVSFLSDQSGDRVTILSIDEILLNGENVTRIIKIDNCYGNILSHELYNRNNELIAKAELKNYRVDSTTGLNMPHRIALSWPKSGYGMTLSIGNIEVNPLEIPKSLWELPRHNQVMDLARQFERMSQGEHVIPVSGQTEKSKSPWSNHHRTVSDRHEEEFKQPAPFPAGIQAGESTSRNHAN